MHEVSVTLAQGAVDAAVDVSREASEALVASLSGEFVRRGDIIKREVLRSYVTTVSKGRYPGDDVEQMGRWLDDLQSFAMGLALLDDSAVAKAERTDKFEPWANRRVKRIGGRFAADTSSASASPSQMRVQSGGRRMAPGAARLNDLGLTESNGRLTYAQTGAQVDEKTRQTTNQYLGALREAQGLQSELRQAFGPELTRHIDLTLTVQDPVQGRLERVHADAESDLASVFDDQIDPSRQRVVGVEANIDQRSLANAPDPAKARRDINARALSMRTQMPGVSANLGRAADMATAAGGRPGALYSSNRERYGRMMEAAGSALGGLGGPTEGVGNVLAAFGRTLGSADAQAVAPYVERAAMRYTGTRAKPSREVVSLLGRNAGDEARGVLAASMAERSKADPSYRGPKPSKDQVRMGVLSDLGALAMARKLPSDPMQAQLSLQAGRTLPSRGIIIDAEGNVQYEAVGTSDDHYTPFDLRMLRKLDGGQFVRTRNSGGPSVEDMRTLFTTNARMATVVSPAGVFEVELDPDVRGRERAVQAGGVVDSYSRMLDQLAGQGLFLGDLPDGQMQAIQAQAMRSYPDPKDAKAREDYVRTQTNALKAQAVADNLDIDFDAERERAEATVREQSGDQLSGRAFSDAVTQVYEENLRKKFRPLMLNGEGYELALQTLAARHPTVIRSVRYRPVNEFMADIGLPGERGSIPSSRGTKDQGYVAPGQVRPKGVGPRDIGTAQAEQTPPEVTSPTSGGTPAGAGAQTASSTAASTPAPGPAAPKVPESAPAVKATQAAASQVEGEARDLIADFAAGRQADGTPIDASDFSLGDPGTYDSAASNFEGEEAEAGKHPVLYAAKKLSGMGRNVSELFDELLTNTDLRNELLAAPGEIKSKLNPKRKHFVDASVGAMGDNDFDKRVSNIENVLRQLATYALLVSPSYEQATPGAMKGRPSTPVLTSEMSAIDSLDAFDRWASSGTESARQATAGREWLTDTISATSGEDMVIEALNKVDELDRRIDTARRRLQPTQIGNDARTTIDTLLGSGGNPPNLPPEVLSRLADSPSLREAEFDRLKDSLRLGFSSLLLRSQLQMADAAVGGGAGPKGQEGLRAPLQAVKKRAPVRVSKRLTTSRLSSRRSSTPLSTV